MIIDDYYKAWVRKDLKRLNELLHDDLFGVRTYQKDTLFDKKSVIQQCRSSNEIDITVLQTKLDGSTIHYELDVDGVLVVAKAKIKDHQLFKIYEEIKRDTTRYLCQVSYDGSSFSGYQRQPNQQTIQGVIEQALKHALGLKNISIHSSGRTDKGVHGINQVFHFDATTKIPQDRIVPLVNSYLPDSISLSGISVVPETFHSRYDVTMKEYVYKINTTKYDPIQRNYEWFVSDVDIDLLQKELRSIIGTHDFKSFTKTTDNDTTRTIFDVWFEEDKDYLYIHIKGNGFMRYMVRYIVGAAVLHNSGKLPYSIQDLLDKKDNTLLKEMAPAGGLYLSNVYYE